MKRPNKKNVLLVYCTHGDELVGEQAVEALTKKFVDPPFDAVLGNPKARAQKARYADSDLNRSAPGKKYSKKYEVRRAFELVQTFSEYERVIDIHQTLANDRIVIIIPKLTKRSLALALALDVRDILIWPPSPGSKSSPLSSYAECGVEIEAGVKTDPARTRSKLVKTLSKFLDGGFADRPGKSKAAIDQEMRKRNFYLVYGRIDPKEVMGIKLKDFAMVSSGKEKFIALLFGRHQNLAGYKMRRVDESWVYGNMRAA